MKNNKFFNLIGTSLLMVGLSTSFISCEDDDNNNNNNTVVAPNVNFTALTKNNSIAVFNARNLNSAISTTPITGLASGEQIISIDYRPATGQLYALSSLSRLYFINEQSGIATALGTSSFTPEVNGMNASIDFNPTVDRIRLVTEAGQNLRLHPETGAVAATDTQISGNSNTKIGAVAYTNSMAGASSTMLFDIDFGEDKLYIQNPPNDGGLQLVGNLTIDLQGQGDFDIIPDNSAALAITNNNNMSKLYTIDLTTGKAVDVGTFGSEVISLAFKTNPVAFAASTDNLLHRFNPMSPMANSVAFTGLMASEMIVGLDFRPANGTLYAISNQSRLFKVNTANGQLTQVGSDLTPALAGTSFGFDFNPTVDRIRLVSNTGQNLRLHPDLGTVVFTDGMLNPGTPFVNAAAYTNNIAGATTTTLFVIDSTTDMLYTQNPPNNGTLVPVGSLGVNVEADNGFDIGGNSNNAYALLKVNGVTSVYSINLTTGAATKGADFNIQTTAIAVGLGF